MQLQDAAQLPATCSRSVPHRFHVVCHLLAVGICATPASNTLHLHLMVIVKRFMWQRLPKATTVLTLTKNSLYHRLIPASSTPEESRVTEAFTRRTPTQSSLLLFLQRTHGLSLATVYIFCFSRVHQTLNNAAKKTTGVHHLGDMCLSLTDDWLCSCIPSAHQQANARIPTTCANISNTHFQQAIRLTLGHTGPLLDSQHHSWHVLSSVCGQPIPRATGCKPTEQHYIRQSACIKYR